jgi:lipid-A-disaccharide synthase
MKRLLITAGDPSGDIIAAHLVEALKKRSPNLFIVGLGGQKLEKVSDRFLGNIVSKHALGFFISPKTILHFRHILNEVLIPEMKENPPDAVIPVDFYGFNSRVAQAAKKWGRPVFYYASPQFWASRPGRAEHLRPFVDMFLCLFPFEVDFYKKKNLPAQFVGHPILDFIPKMAESVPARVELLIGLLPGSRPEEIKRHLPIMMAACEKIATEAPGSRFVLFTVPHVSRDFYHSILNQVKPTKCLIELIQDEGYNWRSQLDMAVTASGMESLENALLGIPMVVIYKTNWVTYAVARMLIRIPHIGMPNLLAGKEIVPEFIQTRVTAENIVAPILTWIRQPALRQELRKNLLGLREKFGGGGASDRAAKVILDKVA